MRSIGFIIEIKGNKIESFDPEIAMHVCSFCPNFIKITIN
jgi:hypothetical protein